MTPAELALDGLATFRLARLMGRDTITEPLRARLFDRAAARATSPVPRASRPSWVLLEMLECPWCRSVYAAGAVLALRKLPGGRAVRDLLALAAVAGLVARHLDPSGDDR